MTIDEARTLVRAAIRFVSGKLDDPRLADSAANLKLADLDLDSMAMIEICMEVEQQTGVEIDLADLKRGTTVDDFCELLVAKAAP